MRPVFGLRPRHPRTNGRADAQPRHAERLHDRTRGFAAGHHQAPQPLRDEALRDLREAGFDQRARRQRAEFALHGVQFVGRRRGADQHGLIWLTCALHALNLRPCQRLRGHRLATRQRARVDRERGPARRAPALHLRVRRERARTGEHGGRAAGRVE